MRGAAILKNVLNKARTDMNRPNWMGEFVWDRFCAHWGSEAYKKKSAQAKLNRASDCGGYGGSLHTSGSITSSQHRANLVKFNNTLSDLWKKKIYMFLCYLIVVCVADSVDRYCSFSIQFVSSYSST